VRLVHCMLVLMLVLALALTVPLGA